MPDALIQMRGISKRFGGVTALQNVDLDANAGEVLAIVGDNGAGKSTLIKILTGVYQPTSGTVRLGGQAQHFASHADAIKVGIDAVYQTLALARMREETERVLMDRLGVRLKSLDAPTESLSGGQRQAVAIARAVYHDDLRVLVMDEPTAALGPQETARTLKLIKTLKAQGLTERRGQCVGVVNTADSSTQEVLGMIVGAKEDT